MYRNNNLYYRKHRQNIKVLKLVCIYLAVLDNIRLRAKETNYGITENDHSNMKFMKTSCGKFCFYLPKIIIAIPTAVLTVLVLCYIEFQITDDMTYDAQETSIHELLVASYVFVSLYICYVFYLCIGTMCVLSSSKIPYQLLGALTCVVFVVLFSMLYAGFVNFHESSSLVFMSLYGIMNFYVWTLGNRN